MKVNENTVVGASWDNADFQFLERKSKKKVIEGAYLLATDLVQLHMMHEVLKWMYCSSYIKDVTYVRMGAKPKASTEQTSHRQLFTQNCTSFYNQLLTKIYT